MMDKPGNGKRKSRVRRRRKTLEFDFDVEDQLMSETEADKEVKPVPKAIEVIYNPEPEEKKEPRTMPTRTQPNRIHASQSVRRQVKEQNTFNTLLSGAALSLISAILVVAGLAGLGGYVLYKQLEDQSATVAILEQNTKMRFYEMETDLIQRDTELARNVEQTNLRLMEMTASFEQYRNETTEVLAEIKTQSKQISNELYRAKKANAQQEIEIARLRSMRSLSRR
ncbi:MAG: hypothetical protein AAFY98_04835 [Verrucomicrobiota bacterium]